MERKFWFKLDKDKIKLQLKDLGRIFSSGRKINKKLTILVLFFILIGVSIALYNNGYEWENDLKENQEVIIEPIISREESITDQESPLLPVEKENKPVLPVEDVVTRPLKPVIESIPSEIQLLKPVSGEILQGPGWYYHPVFDDWRYQYGIELNGNTGDIVMAAAPGEVISITEDEYKGIVLTIEHTNGWRTEYGHLLRTTVSPDENVAKGQEIGRLGSTGITSQASLYFDLQNQEGSIDPINYFE
jgi:murein DD-endopeptidase MepM/ murein hydrolase activator NlpD